MKYEPAYKNIGERIRFERELLGISREKFAELMSLSPVYVGQIERVGKKMSMNSLVNISKNLHSSINYLVFGDNNSQLVKETTEITTLLYKCSNHELEVISNIIKVILPHIK